MPKRYLFGPVTADYAHQHLDQLRKSGTCLAFDHEGRTDLRVEAGETWQSVLKKLPSGWQPDYIALNMDFKTIPSGLWQAAVPLVGLATDWNLLWHSYRYWLRRCELVITDTLGVELLHREGIEHARSGNLYGCGHVYLEKPKQASLRDIDLLFVGNVHADVQRERLKWLPRLARFAERWNVAIHTNVYGEPYRDLLRRARIVFNRSIRGECNQRAFEVVSCGALLFQEADNLETHTYLRDGQDCIYYTDDNLERLLERYLGNELERKRIADSGTQQSQRFRFEVLWEQILQTIDTEWDGMQSRMRNRPSVTGVEAALASYRLALSSTTPDPGLLPHLQQAVQEQPNVPPLELTLGLGLALEGARGDGIHLETSLNHFKRALEADRGYILGHLCLAEGYYAQGKHQEAAEAARQALTQLDRQGELDRWSLQSSSYPLPFTTFRVEWERAAWAHAGQPLAEARAKHDLVRWRLHALLAQVTNDLSHSYEACAWRPDLPETRGGLGKAVARSGRPAQAVEHLRRAVTANPFHRDHARSLFEVLGSVGDREGQRELVLQRRLLSRAAPQILPTEEWVSDAQTKLKPVVSLLILCCNQVDMTRLCLESIFRHTDVPYELVLVDNGSQDETPAYLKEVQAHPGPVRIVVLRNEINRGFGAGCNQALRAAHGDHYLFLNNDVVVTPDWLKGLLYHLNLASSVGLVGCMTNRAAPPHQIPAEYKKLSQLDEFAIRRRQQFLGQSVPAHRLSAFCLLARRSVVARIGDFDERFGLGLFEDDDFCARAENANFELRLALDVFVHHEGSKTLRSLKIDGLRLLHENHDRFRTKWGATRAANYRLPPLPNLAPVEPESGAPVMAGGGIGLDSPSRTTSAATPLTPLPTKRTERPKVSLCMIVRNEEQNLGDCLASVEGLFDEMVIVDTGSTDRTREVARQFGVQLVEMVWPDSFASARNESIRHARGDWIFWMDADDRLDTTNRERLRTLFASLGEENLGYVMQVRSGAQDAAGSARVVDHVRLFRNHPSVRWEYRVHEQILSSICRIGGRERWTDVSIWHVGYQNAATCNRKHDRNLRLLHLDHSERPDDPFTLFNLGWTYQALGRHEEALPWLRRSLEIARPSYSFARKGYALITVGHRRLQQREEALAACRRGLQFYPDDCELLYQEGLLLYEKGDCAGAEKSLQKILTSKPGTYFAIGVDAGLRGYLTRYNLGVIYRDLGRLPEAEVQWRTVVAERPDYTIAWLALGELFLAQSRWSDVDDALAKLRADVDRQLDEAVLRARVHMARQEFDSARTTLEETMRRFPDALWPKVILSHVLLLEGRDLRRAERVLEEILAVSPQHTQSQQNLTLLRQKLGHIQEPRPFSG